MTTAAELLNRTLPTWPTQLHRYIRRGKRSVSDLDDNTSRATIQAKRIDDYEDVLVGNWKGIVHPSGVMYYFNASKTVYTEFNISTLTNAGLKDLDDWIEVIRGRLSQQEYWPIVVEPVMTTLDVCDYTYYLVDLDRNIIAWLEPVDGTILFQECMGTLKWNHKRLELEAQFWKHVEYFPHTFKLHRDQVKKLRIKLVWILTEALTLEQSTAASLFFGNEQTEKMISLLANVEEFGDPSNGLVPETGVVLYGRIMHILYHHQFLNYYGLPEARLIRTHALESQGEQPKFSFFRFTAAMLGVPVMILEQIKEIYVDGLITSLDMNTFIVNFRNSSTGYSTLAGVIMAVDASILAIPNIGSRATAIVLCSCSLVFCVGCIFSGLIVQHFSHKMRSLYFATYYLQEKTMIVAMIYSAPSLLCTVSVALSVAGFLSGLFAEGGSVAICVTCAIVIFGLAAFLSMLAYSGFHD